MLHQITETETRETTFMLKSKPAAMPTTTKEPKKKSASAKDKVKDKDRKAAKDKTDKSKRKAADASDKPKKKLSEATPPPADVRDPDAVQLFRRYDRARAGVILRSDFLQLLRDYAQLPRATHGGSVFGAMAPRRPPLSLTDSHGIPLGYERSAKNSEFEAGQLFERYDKDHVGALSLDKFGEFFRDFQTQLRGFVDDLSYSASAHPPLEHAPVVPMQPSQEQSASKQPEDSPPKVPRTSLRAEYRATLWELRKICRDELPQQRERIRSEMASLQEIMASTDQRERDPGGERRSSWWATANGFDDVQRFPATRDRIGYPSWRGNQLMDRYDAIETDLERLDEVVRVTGRQLRRGLDVIADDMIAFLEGAPQLLADARELAMKDFGVSPSRSTTREGRREERTESPKDKELQSPRNVRQNENSDPAPGTSASDQSPQRNADQATVNQLQKTLLVRDQLIYQLLQERAALRKQKASIESDLQDLTEISTNEMRKWAQLTDEMQEEIAFLRDQLISKNQRHDEGSVFS